MKLEFIDILHFAMSEAIARNSNLHEIASQMGYWYEMAYVTEEDFSQPDSVPKPTQGAAYNFQSKKQYLFKFLSSVFAYYGNVEQHEALKLGGFLQENTESDGEDDLDEGEIKSTLESFAEDGIDAFDWPDFWQTAFFIGLSLEDVYLTYIGKAALNHHRSISGDAKGLYVKLWWNDQEDNFYLNKKLKALSASGNLTSINLDNIRTWLNSTYKIFMAGDNLPSELQ